LVFSEISMIKQLVKNQAIEEPSTFGLQIVPIHRELQDSPSKFNLPLNDWFSAQINWLVTLLQTLFSALPFRG
jgi:hypothetical protein